jgi:bidirectional [NiFe] hydrogenase diaphorase subunit
MTRLFINGIETEVPEGTSVLEAAQSLGAEIPTLCSYPGLSAYGACRLCVVEVGDPRSGPTKLVSACTYPVQEGLRVRTHSPRVERARKMLIELLLSICPSSKRIQDLAAGYQVERVRFPVRDERCILCGLCVRMCAEQMMARAIGFAHRGYRRKVTTPFDLRSEVCRLCGGCLYVCPVCELRCQGPEAPDPICGSCQAPTCLSAREDLSGAWEMTGGDSVRIKAPREAGKRSAGGVP